MESTYSIRCRVVACRGLSGSDWDFYLINDGDEPIESAVLIEIGYEWGNLRGINTVDVTVSNIPPVSTNSFTVTTIVPREGSISCFAC